jgi:hypothetical protein
VVYEPYRVAHSEFGGLAAVHLARLDPEPKDIPEMMLRVPTGEVGLPLGWSTQRVNRGKVGANPTVPSTPWLPPVGVNGGALGVLAAAGDDEKVSLVEPWALALPEEEEDSFSAKSAAHTTKLGYLALPNLSFFRPYYLLEGGVEYVGRPDAAVAGQRADLARLYQQIEGVPEYYNSPQCVAEALRRVRIPLGTQEVCRGRLTGLVSRFNSYNFPSRRLYKGYNSELGAYYSQLAKRTVPRALGGITFSEGRGVRFRYPEIFTAEQCRLRQERAGAWGSWMWANFATLWQPLAPTPRVVRVDPPLYHNL